MLQTCPECDAHLSYDDRCKKCGWLKPVAPVVHTSAADNIKQTLRRKAQEDAEKWLKERGMLGIPVSELIAESKRLAAARPEYPGMDWAHRLLSRIADGENVPPIAEQMARAAVRRSEPPREDLVDA